MPVKRKPMKQTPWGAKARLARYHQLRKDTREFMRLAIRVYPHLHADIEKHSNAILDVCREALKGEV